MFRKKKRVSENFNVGNANMEIPSYEIKINGQVPIDYATAINDRQARKEKIEKDFEFKNKITDEVIDDTHDRYEERDNMVLEESADDNIKLYKRADKLAREIESFIQDITEINWEDFTTETDIDTLNKAVAAFDGFATAYSYIMDNEDVFESKQDVEKIKAEYKKLAAKLEAKGKDMDNETVFESMSVDFSELKKEVQPALKEYRELPDNAFVLYRYFFNQYAYGITGATRYLDIFYGFDTRKEAIDFRNKHNSFFKNYSKKGKESPYGDVGAKTVFSKVCRKSEVPEMYGTSLSAYKVIKEQVNEDYEPKCKKNPCICECDGLKEATTRNRSKNTKKEDKMYSTDDLWLQVYDDLSSEVENEGPKGEVNKQVDIPRGKRFVGPYAGPGDYDLTVYGKNIEDLQWAKKVADHYGVDIEIKKDTNRRTNTYYPYTAILKDIK